MAVESTTIIPQKINKSELVDGNTLVYDHETDRIKIKEQGIEPQHLRKVAKGFLEREKRCITTMLDANEPKILVSASNPDLTDNKIGWTGTIPESDTQAIDNNLNTATPEYSANYNETKTVYTAILNQSVSNTFLEVKLGTRHKDPYALGAPYLGYVYIYISNDNTNWYRISKISIDEGSFRIHIKRIFITNEFKYIKFILYGKSGSGPIYLKIYEIVVI